MTFPSSVYSVPYMLAIYSAMREHEAEASRWRLVHAAWRAQHPHHGRPGPAVPQRPTPRLVHAH
ncbi:MAG: hypothetical protein P1P87_01605 [Trueperaceae bacterium]|nr:hypothetical protein [Trueperaceae bacterium]